MAAYIVGQVEVTDWEQYKVYMASTAGVIEKYDGKFISRGGEVVTLEGPEQTRRMVILEFPSMEKANGWYESPEYQASKKLREGAAVASFIAVDGC